MDILARRFSLVGSGSFDFGPNDNNVSVNTDNGDNSNDTNDNNTIGFNNVNGGSDVVGSATAAGESPSLSAGISSARTDPSSEFTLLVVLVVLVGLLVLLAVLLLAVLLLWIRRHKSRNILAGKLLDVEETVEEVSQPLPAAAET
ncbi:hypothetical protein C8R44DRAFT_866309 [Mycena epipterygia]|nr:hypothetical protein C8R44DRAFT_866309 [Mycena epipterygia]